MRQMVYKPLEEEVVTNLQHEFTTKSSHVTLITFKFWLVGPENAVDLDHLNFGKE